MSPQTTTLFLVAATSGSMMAISQKLLAWYSIYRSYVIANGVAFLLSLVAWRWLDKQPLAWSSINVWMIVLGVALFVLNMSYIRLYQQNINLAYVPVIVTALITIVLLVVGLLVFRESISLQAIVGMLVVGAGLWLIVSG